MFVNMNIGFTASEVPVCTPPSVVPRIVCDDSGPCGDVFCISAFHVYLIFQVLTTEV